MFCDRLSLSIPVISKPLYGDSPGRVYARLPNGTGSAAATEPVRNPLKPETCTSRTGYDCVARPPTGRVGAEPVRGLSLRPVISRPHIHAPGEDPAVRAVHSPLAIGNTRGSPEARFEVSSVPDKDVDEAHIIFHP